MNTEQRIANAGRFSEQANRIFLSEGREPFAFHKQNIQQPMLAMIQLHFRDEIANMEPSVEGYLLIQKKAYLILLDRGAIEFVGPLPKIAQDVIDRWRRETGVGLATLPPPPAPDLTPEQKLAQEVINDWNTLSNDQIRKKRDSDRNYARVLKQLLESDKLSPNSAVMQYGVTR